MFVTEYGQIETLIDNIDPIEYGKTRNYIDGAVTKLSPYISRGVITTRQVARAVLKKGYKPYQIESFLKELAWRDYFQQVWLAKGESINQDLKQPQPNILHHAIPVNIVQANTGINAIDDGIKNLHNSGYIHNHLRMYVASVACNIAQSHWLQPARWMYYYLLDADWASNALSWQWVAGSFSSKKYVANQQNINKYCGTLQHNTFLDVEYEMFSQMQVPEVLKETSAYLLETNLPQTGKLNLNNDLPIYVYNFYNLDCNWQKEVKANRVLLLEPEFFKQYPVSEKVLEFILQLAKNIENIQIAVGAFKDIFPANVYKRINYKEHPTNKHYEGAMHERAWMFPMIQGYYPSFFAYWKKCEKHLEQLMQPS